MKIGHFDETEQNDDVDDVDDMDADMDDADADMDDADADMDDVDDVDDMDDADEDMDDADADMDDVEDDMEAPEGGEADEGDDSGEEKKSIADMIKEKLSSIFDSKENDETEEAGEADESDEADEKEESDGEEKSNPWELPPESKADTNSRMAETAKDFREAHNLDEHGQKLDNGDDNTDDTENSDAPKTHGDDGELVREANKGAEIDDDELEH